MEKLSEQSNMFNPIKNKTIVEQVITTISNLIKNKKLNPGDKIMNEYALAKSLQVSRSSVREALKILHAFGVLEVKVGDGTYISKGVKVSPLEILGYCLMLDKSSHNLIFQLRAMLETGLMYILIDKVTDEELEMLEEHIEKQRKVGEKSRFDYEEYTKLDIDFHIKLASLVENGLIEKVYRTMVDIFSTSIERSVVYQKGHETNIKLHRNLINVLRSGDKNKIYDAVMKSLEIWEKTI